MPKDNSRPQDQPMELLHMCGPTEADMIAEILKNNGIECSLQGEVAAETLPATGDLDEVRIWVDAADLPRAKEFVEAFFSENETIEEEE